MQINPMVFFRDDDVGTLDPSIIRLTDIFEKYDAPATYSATPTKISKEFVDYFISKEKNNLFDIVQHGFSHTDYKVDGVFRGEFGTNRAREDKEKDIVEGFNILKKYFGDRAFKIFTPPWGTMDIETYDLISAHDYLAYSIKRNPGTNLRNRIHDILKHHYILKKSGPVNLSVSIDFMKDWKSKTAKKPIELLKELTGANKTERFIGIMLHDKIMNDEAFASLEDFLKIIKKKNIPVLNMGTILKL